VKSLQAAHPKTSLIAALPSVFFEQDRPGLEALVAACRELGIPVEVNTWGGWLLAQRGGARIVGGPGLGVLNALAVQALADRGFEEVTASIEADAIQLEGLLSRACLPVSMGLFGRPALMTTRVALSPEVTGGVLEDRREVKLLAHAQGGLWQLRPVQPFDLRRVRTPAGAAHLVVDLVGSPDPHAEWNDPVDGATSFNLGRTLA
jgi:hypothetical protein